MARKKTSTAKVADRLKRGREAAAIGTANCLKEIKHVVDGLPGKFDQCFQKYLDADEAYQRFLIEQAKDSK